MPSAIPKPERNVAVLSSNSIYKGLGVQLFQAPGVAMTTVLPTTIVPEGIAGAITVSPISTSVPMRTWCKVETVKGRAILFVFNYLH